jgi:hypothetical protein
VELIASQCPHRSISDLRPASSAELWQTVLIHSFSFIDAATLTGVWTHFYFASDRIPHTAKEGGLAATLEVSFRFKNNLAVGSISEYFKAFSFSLPRLARMTGDKLARSGGRWHS